MIKLVAFDWNGTLLADTSICCRIDNYILKHFGKEQITAKRFKDTFDIPISKMYLANGFTEEELRKHGNQLVHMFHDAYELAACTARTRAGAKEVLRWLKKNNVTSVIFSNHTLSGIDAQFKRLGLSHLFDVVIANELREGSMRGRNKKEKLHDYIKEKKYKKHEVVLIGDTLEEIEIGKEIDVDTVAITGGNHSHKTLRQAKPTFIIHNLLDIKKIVKASKNI